MSAPDPRQYRAGRLHLAAARCATAAARLDEAGRHEAAARAMRKATETIRRAGRLTCAATGRDPKTGLPR